MIYATGAGSTNGSIENCIGTLLVDGLIPETTNSADIVTSSKKFKDIHIDGIAYLDEVDIDAGNIDGVNIGANSPIVNLTVDNVNINGNNIKSTTNQLSFITGGTAERIRIDASGNIFYGGITSTSANENASAYIDTNTTLKSYQGTGIQHITFLNGATTVGSISNNGANASFNTTSDYRVKDKLGEIEDAVERVLELQPLLYSFIGNEDIHEGFIAHEVDAVVPNAVTGDKDAVDPITDAPILQQLDLSKLVPLLTQALKKAIWKIDDLQEKVEELQDAVSEI